MHAPVGVLQRLREIHETAAFGVHGTAVVDREATHRLAAPRIVGQVLRIELGIAAAEVESVDVGRLAVGERAPLHQLGARLAQ